MKEKLPSAKSLCVTNGFVFVCSADGIIVVEHTSQLSIKVQSLRKAELIAELTKRGVEATGNVTQLKNKLNLENEKLRAQYASVKKRTDIVHLNKDIHTVDCLCSVSDEILFVGSNVDQKVYQVLIEKDGVGLVGSVTQSFTYPQNDIKVVSMTTSAGSLFFSSVGPQGQDDYGGLFQVNLESNLPTCLVRNSPNCEVHGIAPYKNGIAFSDIKTNQIKQYHCLSGVSILAGNGKEGNVKGNAKFASFMQPAGLCSELDTNLFPCDSQNGEVVLITGLQGTCVFLSSIGKMFRAFSIHKKHNFLAPLPTVVCGDNLKSVADYITLSVDKVKALTGKNTTNGPDGTVSSKTLTSVRMVADGVQKLNENIQMLNEDYQIDMASCMTGQVESIHSTHHHKNQAGAHVIDYARSFGNTVKEGLKRTTRWAAHYYTNKKSYYPIPSNSIMFWDIPFLPPLPPIEMSDENQEYMREWARDNGKSVRQRTVRQETTKYKAGTLPLNMYETHNPVGQRIQFHQVDDLDGLAVFDEVDECQNGQDEYSDESGSRDTEESESSGKEGETTLSFC
jgi:hypothetical protein